MATFMNNNQASTVNSDVDDSVLLHKLHFSLANEVLALIIFFFVVPKVITSTLVGILMNDVGDQSCDPLARRNGSIALLSIMGAFALLYIYKYTRYNILSFGRHPRFLCVADSFDCCCWISESTRKELSEDKPSALMNAVLFILATLIVLCGTVVASIDIYAYVAKSHTCSEALEVIEIVDISSSVVILIAALFLFVQAVISCLSAPAIADIFCGLMDKRGSWSFKNIVGCPGLAVKLLVRAFCCCSNVWWCCPKLLWVDQKTAIPLSV